MNRLGLALILTALLLTAGAAHAEWGFADVTEQLVLVPPDVGAVAWGDIDNDGDADLFLGGQNGAASVLLRNDHGWFTDASAEHSLPLIRDVRQARFLDYNNDGYLDLFLVTHAGGRGFRILEQLPTGEFINVPVEIGEPYDDEIRSAVWIDVNGDGRLDLVLSNGHNSISPMSIYVQDGFEFAEMRDNPFQNGLDGVGAMAVMDYDNDGDLDVFCGYAQGEGWSHLYRNHGGAYTDWAGRFEFPQKLGATGAVWFDYDNDGRFDLFAPGPATRTHLFKGMTRYGTAGLTEVPDLTNMWSDADDGIYVQAVDADMDGWTDLFITKSDQLGCALLRNLEGRGWCDVASDLNIANIGCTNLASAWADFDGDGDLDLVLAQGTSGVRLYQNDIKSNQEWLVVNLRDADTHSPLPNCNAYMVFEQCKKCATTAFATCSAGGDASSLLLVSDAKTKSPAATLVVYWPNGVEAHYGLDQVGMWQVNDLFQPTSGVQTGEDVMLAHYQGGPITQVVSPNPFNPSAWIGFTLPQAAEIDLKVYNLIGQEVASLAHGACAAGQHRVVFDASGLPSGLYLSRLDVAGQVSICRMLLAK
jgi:hypothetical protein